LRAEVAKRMNLRAGPKALDLGCGIGGATFPLAEITGPTRLVAGVDISGAMIEAATERAKGRAALGGQGRPGVRDSLSGQIF
jgi:ubiquinone/menaquinone biosynthesis C-methylase UbiE